MSSIAYEHLKEVQQIPLNQIISQATIVEPTTTVGRAIGMMLDTDSYDIFSTTGASVLTTNARQLLAARDISAMKVSLLLQKIQSLSKNDTVEKAATMMSHYRMRSVPVVENSAIVGVVKAKDIINLLAKQNLRWVTANTVLTRDPITLGSSEPLAKARKIMMSKRIDHIPIIRSNKVGQVLTSMHLLGVLNPEEKIGRRQIGTDPIRAFESQIGNMGSTRVTLCKTNDSLDVIIDGIIKNDTTCCLLTLWDSLHGIITYRDILNLLQTRLPSDVPLYIIGMPEDASNAEIVKSKFQKIIKNLIKVYPEVEEARTSIKVIHSILSERQNFEVAVRIFTPYRTYNYTETGWDLSQIFDTLGRRIIRNLSKRSKRRWKTSVRKIDKKTIF